MNEKDVVLETKTINDISGCFFVPDYQRGYRWGRQQVEMLLNDLWGAACAPTRVGYCLQPIVVKRLHQKGEPARYELIDGQQRLTTIYILLSYLKGQGVPGVELKFSLDYQTRKETANFLTTLSKEKALENIDFYHIYNVHKCIDEWFARTAAEDATAIAIATVMWKLFSYMGDKYLKLIWYEVGAEEDPNKIFTRLNIGQIKLTNAELIKALLLKGKSERDRLEIGMQWDDIEKLLSSGDDEFWYFLTREDPKHYPTRIEFLFDLKASKKADEREEYFTFLYFNELLKEKDSSDVWNEIVKDFLCLKEWHEDTDLYHKIGYLVSSGSMTMGEVFVESKGKRKSEFKTCLEKRIIKSIDFGATSIEDYFELSYEIDEDKEKISKLLLLFNVMSVLKNQVYQRFPFCKYNTAEWSLEHIHAQQSKGLMKQEDQKEWLRMHCKSLEDVCPEESELIEMVKVKSSQEYQITRSEFDVLFDKVRDKLSESPDHGYLHSISNMALLTRTDNAALNNSTFDVKRNKIVEMDQRGEFIPYCTKMVFLKYYTPSGDNQVHFWGAKDRKAYVDAIKSVLSSFITIHVKEA